MRALVLININVHIKFDILSFTRCKDDDCGPKIKEMAS